MKSFTCRSLLQCLLIALVVCASSSYGQMPAPSPTDTFPAPDVHISGAPRQGGFLLITAAAAPPVESCSWLGQKYQISLGRCVLPVPVDTKPGGHRLEMSNTAAALSRTITVHHT